MLLFSEQRNLYLHLPLVSEIKQFQLLTTVGAAGKKTTFTSHASEYNSNIFLKLAVQHTFTLFNTGAKPVGTTHSWKYKGPAQIGKMLTVESLCGISSSSSSGQHLQQPTRDAGSQKEALSLSAALIQENIFIQKWCLSVF